MGIIDYIGEYMPLGEGIWGWFGLLGSLFGIILFFFYAYIFIKHKPFGEVEK